MQAEQMISSAKPIWTPSGERIENSHLFAFKNHINSQYNQNFQDYYSLWSWSNDNIEDFWSECWDFCEIIGKKGNIIAKNLDSMLESRFFPESEINYAENLLKCRDDSNALIFRDENGKERSLTFEELYDQVSLWQQLFMNAGIQKGDRIAACMPNVPETIIAMLACTSLGAIWSSASPDFGEQGLLDRFGQIEPKILIACDSYLYNGKTIACQEKIENIQGKIPSLEKTILVPFFDQDHHFLSPFKPQDINFTRCEFDHPLFIMFSSGTTGVPKCIVHGHGGTLLQHMKEFKLQLDVKKGDSVFYFTTCGWMMWNWLATGLAAEATLLLFDGSPFYPDGNILWDYTSKHNCTLFGTSAKYIEALKKADLKPEKTHDLSALKTITSTGSPLVHSSFDYVYDSIKKDVHLASIYGGTDIISASFGIGNPISPVHRGEIQGPALATKVSIYDENGQTITDQAGELVCERPFPSMPVKFWNDQDGSKYKKAYFETYENIWHHGDWVEENSETHGLIIYGRSDATLNPGGVRIGTAEIYRQVEKIPAIKESVAVGQDWDDDVRVILFVVMQDEETLSEELQKQIKTQIRTGASPRHMPAKIIAVNDIPRTKSGKITEIAVRDTIMGRPIKNVTALANPESLELFKDIEELQS